MSEVKFIYPKSVNHFELCYLTVCKAVSIVRSAKSLIPHVGKFKPKVAVLALNELCESDIDSYKKEVMHQIFGDHKEEESDSYEVDID